MPNRALYLAAYDIRDSRRLRAALNCLKAYATGGQKSLFECFLTDAEKHALMDDMAALITNDDRFLLARLDPRCKVHALGRAVPPSDPEFYYHG